MVGMILGNFLIFGTSDYIIVGGSHHIIVIQYNIILIRD
jgi:hypothetical protein